MKLPKLPRQGPMKAFHCDPLPEGEDIFLCQNAPLSAVNLEKTCRRCRRNRRGAAAVEFAIVAPVFFLMAFGMIEFGRAIMVKQILTSASRVGARVAVLDGSTVTGTNGVKGTVASYLTNAGIPGASESDVTINPADPATAVYGAPVTVTVQVPYSRVSWLPSPKFFRSTTLKASTVMRRETVQ
jgi:Flp pilus assembly protein TadG